MQCLEINEAHGEANMGYYSSGKADVGNIVRVGPNTKGTGTRGVPVAIQLMHKDRPSAPKGIGTKKVTAPNFTSKP